MGVDMEDRITVTKETFQGYSTDSKLDTLYDITCKMNDKIENRNTPWQKTLTFCGSMVGSAIICLTWLKFGD